MTQIKRNEEILFGIITSVNSNGSFGVRVKGRAVSYDQVYPMFEADGLEVGDGVILAFVDGKNNNKRKYMPVIIDTTATKRERIESNIVPFSNLTPETNKGWKAFGNFKKWASSTVINSYSSFNDFWIDGTIHKAVNDKIFTVDNSYTLKIKGVLDQVLSEVKINKKCAALALTNSGIIILTDEVVDGSLGENDIDPNLCSEDPDNELCKGCSSFLSMDPNCSKSYEEGVSEGFTAGMSAGDTAGCLDATNGDPYQFTFDDYSNNCDYVGDYYNGYCQGYADGYLEGYNSGFERCS